MHRAAYHFICALGVPSMAKIKRKVSQRSEGVDTSLEQGWRGRGRGWGRGWCRHWRFNGDRGRCWWCRGYGRHYCCRLRSWWHTWQADGLRQPAANVKWGSSRLLVSHVYHPECQTDWDSSLDPNAMGQPLSLPRVYTFRSKGVLKVCIDNVEMLMSTKGDWLLLSHGGYERWDPTTQRQVLDRLSTHRIRVEPYQACPWLPEGWFFVYHLQLSC